MPLANLNHSNSEQNQSPLSLWTILLNDLAGEETLNAFTIQDTLLTEKPLNSEETIRRIYWTKRLLSELFDINFSELEKKLFALLEKLYPQELFDNDWNAQPPIVELVYAISFIARMRHNSLSSAYTPKKSRFDAFDETKEIIRKYFHQLPGDDLIDYKKLFEQHARLQVPTQFKIDLNTAAELIDCVWNEDGLGFVVIMELLPEPDRVKFATRFKRHINPSNIGYVTNLLPESERYNFIDKNKKHVCFQNLPILLNFLSQKTRYDFYQKYRTLCFAALDPDLRDIELSNFFSIDPFLSVFSQEDIPKILIADGEYLMSYQETLQALPKETLRKVYPHLESFRILESLKDILPLLNTDKKYQFIEKNLRGCKEKKTLGSHYPWLCICH